MLIVLSFLVALVVIYLLIPSPAFNRFEREVLQSLANHPPLLHQGVFTEQDIAALPEPVRRYFHVCGFIGKQKMTNAALEIEAMQLKSDLKKDFFPVSCFQFNSIAEPTRIVYLKAKMSGFIPFDGRDKFCNGHGNMLIRVLKLIPVQNVTGPEMDKSALVTFLAEILMLPNGALQPYIHWTPVDSKTAIATLSHQGVSVSGIFHFNEAGEATMFETDDRYMSQPDGSNVKTKWFAFMNGYREHNGIRFASDVSAAWEIDGVKKVYGKLSIRKIIYDVSSLDEVLLKQ